MYHVYTKKEDGFGRKTLMAKFQDLDKAYDAVDAELDKDPNFKYVIEETTGHVNNYGELIATVIYEN